MEIVETSIKDICLVVDLITRVSELDIMTHFNEQGRRVFASKIPTDVETAFNSKHFQSLKVLDADKLVGFGAIRDSNYITHLFIDKAYQGTGLGKLLMVQLLALSNLNLPHTNLVRLRSSVNAIKFYEKMGFKATDVESQVDGIRFIPMSRAMQIY